MPDYRLLQGDMRTVLAATIRFKNDTPTRRRLMVPESFAHPAKGHLGMWALMIERYSQPGETILDPMAGSGATLLAALMGRNVVCVELESHFVEPMRRSWERMRQMPMLGCDLGEVHILQGDARALPLLSADTILTSPPYGEAQSGGGINAALHGKGDYHVTTNLPGSSYSPEEQSHGSENIGNMRGAAYWDSETGIGKVYAECWRVLRPGGLMALVLKGYTRDGQYVDLPQQTEDLLLAAGWVKHDHWRRELWSLSFWRILQQRRDPAAFDERLKYEEVLVVRKPGEDEGGVTTILPSPPYESSLHGAQEGPGAHADPGASREGRVKTMGSYTGR